MPSKYRDLPELTPAQWDLVVRYDPLALKYARRCWQRIGGNYPLSDVISLYRDQLMTAARDWREDGGMRFAALAILRFRDAADECRRRTNREGPSAGGFFPDGRSLGGGEVTSSRSDSEAMYPCISSDPWPYEFLKWDMEKWLLCLPKRHRKVISSIYLDGLTQAETARACGISKARVCVVHREALGYLRERVAREYDLDPQALPA